MNRDTKATVLPALTIDLLKEEGFLAENAFTELWRRVGVKTILNHSGFTQRSGASMLKRIMKALIRHGALIEEEGMTYLAEIETDPALSPLQSATCSYRIALGRRAGQKVLMLKIVSTQKFAATRKKILRQCTWFQLACRSALCNESVQRTGTPVPLYHATGNC
jgi:hypothetical protein